MKQQLFSAVLAMLLTAASGLADEAKPAASGPKIQFAKTVFDVGSTSMVQTVSGKFAFQNTGTAELVLQKPQPSCGCTVASVKPESLKLAPGEKGEIGFVLSVGSARGHLEKHITVNCNDPATPMTSLTIKADMAVVFDANPLQIMLGELAVGFATNVTVLVKRNDGQKLVITKLETSNPFITASMTPVEGATGTAANVTLQIKPDGAPRHFYERVNVYAEGAAFPVIAVPVFGQLVGELRIVPEAVFWGIADPDHFPGPRPELMTIRTIRISATKPETVLNVRNPTCTLKELLLELVTVETGKSYQIVAKLKEPPKESQHGLITVETSLPDHPTVAVPVNVNVLRR